MRRQRSVLFIQLPQLDNDTGGPSENLNVAATYLEHAIRNSDEAPFHRFVRLQHFSDQYATPELIKTILEIKPDVIAATLYLWNIEWTLRLLQKIKRLLTKTHIIVGGPEVARHHPFLYRSRIPDVIVSGEGESVFPQVLKALRLGHTIDFRSVAVKNIKGYTWGTTPPPPVILADALPPVGHPTCSPDNNGMAYMETSRGCPMRCTYCRYAHLRLKVSFLNPDEVTTRIIALRNLGAREIRFIDPTFNAHPHFQTILRQLVLINRDKTLKFFAEVMAERLTPDEAHLLAAANFTEIEVGMQSRDHKVLREIRRPSRLAELDRGIALLSRHKIRATLDIMYALPKQTLSDVKNSVAWCLRQPLVNVQSLQTLLLPGTELRARNREWNYKALSRPPYAALSTNTLSTSDMARIEILINRHPRLRSDAPTDGFIGRKLKGLFDEQIVLNANDLPAVDFPGKSNRRTYIIRGQGLFQHRQTLLRFVTRCVRTQPDTLFQFVLAPISEEPLDLLDSLIGSLRTAPEHLIDRYASVMASNRIASRRIRILLPAKLRFSQSWIQATEKLLSDTFA